MIASAMNVVRTCVALALLLVAPACEAQTETVPAAPVPKPVVTVPASPAQIKLSFAPVVEAVAPAVVSITTRKASRRSTDPFANDPFFKYFFRDFGVPFRQEEREQASLGSGVLVRGDGLIVTNHHVIDGADEITVVMHDRRELTAVAVASDERTDLAFLMLENAPSDLPVIAFGDSDRLAVGDLVLALGNPFGIGQTVTSGIVSAKSRSTPGGRAEVSFIQTDAAINPGNSGGALVSLDGELVGINTAIFTRSGGSIGIGFAIPANLVQARMLAIDEDGEFERPWLGASVQPIDTALAQALDLPRPQGVLVNRIYPGAAADRAGLQQGDVILAVDDIEVFDAPGLALRLSLEPLGSEVPIRIFKGGRETTADLAVEAAPEQPAPDITVLDGRHPLDGLAVANMSPGFNERFDIDMFERGVVVVDIDRNSFASRLRLRPGDEIVEVNGNDVGDVDGLEELLQGGGQRWQVSVRRGGRVFDLTIG